MLKVRWRRNAKYLCSAINYHHVSSEDTDHMLPISPWRFALVLLRLAAVLIVVGAAYPEFFSDSLSHFGTDTP
jgi:hypothetical protein